MSRDPCDIAHDFASVVTVIRGSAELARVKLEPSHPAEKDIRRIIDSCEEAAARVMELRRVVCSCDGVPALD